MNVAIIGYGKMGHEIERLLLAAGDSVALVIDKDNAEDINPDKMKGIDVAIEFSAPDAAYDNVVRVIKCGVPVVCGTTAWLDKLPEVQALAKELGGAFFYASNYSIGVNVMFRANRYIAEMMNSFTNYDVTVDEIHHTAKLDAPSGTAVTIADDIVSSLSRKEKWVLGCSTQPEELNVAALRRSIVPGTHTVVWDSEVDELSLTHRAKGRTGFAAGAITAARFLVGKKGYFTMDDLFGF